MKMISRCIQPSRVITRISGHRKENLHLQKTLTTKSNYFFNRTSDSATFRTESGYIFPSQSLPFIYRQFSDDNSNNKGKEEGGAGAIDLSKFTKEIEIKLPDIVEDNKAKIVQWYKKEGDIINPNDTLCDIETEMFTFEYQVEDECLGVMKEIILAEGEETKDTSSPICIILHEEEEEAVVSEAKSDGEKKDNE